MRLEHSICVAMRGRYINDPNSRVSGLPTKQRLEIGVGWWRCAYCFDNRS